MRRIIPEETRRLQELFFAACTWEVVSCCGRPDRRNMWHWRRNCRRIIQIFRGPRFPRVRIYETIREGV